MVNHVRTLLLNRNGSDVADLRVAGAELVPSDYRAVTLPSWLQGVRAALFGTAPDLLMMNYRLQQFLAVLHATELHEHVLAYDPRISYRPRRRADFFTDAFYYRALPGSGAPSSLYLQGTPRADDAAGRMEWSWQVRLDVGEAQVWRLQPSAQLNPDVTALTYTDYLSQPVALPGSGLYFQAASQQANWTIEARGRPRRGLGDILRDLEALLDGNLGGPLFGADLDQEPDATYRRLWQEDDRDLYRLGAVLLAVARRTERLRGTM